MKNNLDWTEIDLEALPTNFIPRASYQRAVPPTFYSGAYKKWQKPDGTHVDARSGYRMIWRRMASVTGERTLHVALTPPGTAHVDNVYSAGSVNQIGQNGTMIAAVAGVCSSLVADFMLKVVGASKISGDDIGRLPIDMNAEIVREIVPRFLRLVCVTASYSSLWEEVMNSPWNADAAERDAEGRRRLLVEIDVLVAIMAELGLDELCSIYRTQFPVLRGYEQNDLYDVNGRKVPGKSTSRTVSWANPSP